MAETTSPGTPSRRREASRHKLTLVYALMVSVTVGAFAIIREFGERLQAPALPPGRLAFGGGAGPAGVDTLLQVLLALVVVIATARAGMAVQVPATAACDR